MPRIRLDIAYDGTGFSGWARQPGLRTCQGELERALETVAREPVRLVVAGRTDAGVHASGQVAHADIPDGFDFDERLAHRLSRLASADGDLVVQRVGLAPDGFDARFSAISRFYRYRIVTGTADPLERRTAAYVADELNTAVMQRVATSFLGLRDFAAFCKPREGATTIRRLTRFEWVGEDGILTAQLAADAFCHSMVRALVSTCVHVGQGTLGLAEAVKLIEASERSQLTGLMPPHGLTLTGVDYPPDDQLAAQAERARAVRAEIGPGNGEPQQNRT